MKNAKRAALVAVALAGLVAVSGCAGGSGDADDTGDSLLVWSLEEQPDRLAKAQAAAAEFSEASGIEVEVVGINEDQFPQLITAAAAAGDLPDVVGALPLAAARTMSSNDLANFDAMQSVVDDLGADTFSEASLAYTEDDGQRVGVPSDGFPVSVIYRKDLFDAAGLAAPTSYDLLMEAVETLDGPDIAGFVGGNDPGTGYTQQVFEFVGLGNGCELVDGDGVIGFTSPACENALDFYGTLNRDYSVPGAMDSTTTKTVYMAGQAAITIWASFILDEMAGLVADAMPTCPECADDPQFIAKNSGFVTSLEGPDGGPASFGEVTSWVISSSAPADSASQFVSYMLDEGYVDWLSQAPEGKFPTRLGTADEPEKFVEEWRELSSGVDSTAKLVDIYGPEILTTLQDGVNSFSRWGFSQGQGALMGAINAELPVAEAVAEVSTGQEDAAAAAAKAQEAIEAIKATLP